MEAAEKTFLANLDTLPAIVGFVSEHAAAMGVHPKRVMHLELAVEEAAVNICSYAYEIPPGAVTVRITPEPGVVRIELIDNGVPFDPLSMDAPDIKSELENREVGGLGIFLIRRMLDEVHYSRSGDQNILSLAVRHDEK
ncbi:MAG: ATP-binding protein [Veillonellaceae bacterium]|nr:ATP-binding protein [Veillonellaceae bacterium]